MMQLRPPTTDLDRCLDLALHEEMGLCEMSDASQVYSSLTSLLVKLVTVDGVPHLLVELDHGDLASAPA
jgi:hypothetical protein